MPKGVYLSNLVLQLLNTNYLWLAIFTSDGGAAGFGAEVPFQYGYQRLPLGLNAWNPPANGQTYNLNQIAYPKASQMWANGASITTFGLADSPNYMQGNLWIYNDLKAELQQPVLGTSQLIFNPGSLTLLEV
jgi:hypothetical protein